MRHNCKRLLFFSPVAFFFLVFIFLCFLLDSYPLPSAEPRLRSYDGEAEFYSDGVFVETGKLPYNFAKKNGLETTETRFLVPVWVEDGDVMHFLSGLASVRVLFDDDVIYEYLWSLPEDGMNDAGFLFSHYIDLPEDAAGHEIRIIQRNNPSSYNNGQRDVFFGNQVQAELAVFSDGAYTIIFSISMLFVASMGLALTKVSKDHDTKKALTSLSQLALCMFLWLFSQTGARQLIFANPFTASSISYWCIYFFPFLLFKYFTRNYELRSSKGLVVFSFFSRALIGLYVVLGVLSLFRIVNFAQTVQPATVMVLAYCVMLLIYSLYLLILKKEDVLVFIFTLVSFVISFVMEEIDLLFKDKDISSLLVHSFILIAAFLVIYRTLYVFFFSNEGHDLRKVRAYSAYLDPLTGLKNRESYENFLSNPDAYLLGKKSICVVMVDLNRLKQINDTFGHHRGDNVLRAASKALQKVFCSKDASIYRMGGDEFIVIFPVEKEMDVDAMLAELKRCADEQAGDVDVLSAGKCIFNRRKTSIIDAIAAADLDMYKNKAQAHANTECLNALHIEKKIKE